MKKVDFGGPFIAFIISKYPTDPIFQEFGGGRNWCFQGREISEKGAENQRILGKYLRQIQVFWGKKPGFGGLELKFIPKKAFPRFSCFQPPLFWEKFPKKENFPDFGKPDRERLRDFGLFQVFIGTGSVWPIPKIPWFSDCWDHPTAHPDEDPPSDSGGKRGIWINFGIGMGLEREFYGMGWDWGSGFGMSPLPFIWLENRAKIRKNLIKMGFKG